jgi:hypothetical protein
MVGLTVNTGTTSILSCKSDSWVLFGVGARSHLSLADIKINATSHVDSKFQDHFSEHDLSKTTIARFWD